MKTEEIELKDLSEISQKLDKIIKQNEKILNHVTFVESTYDTCVDPLNWILEKIGTTRLQTYKEIKFIENLRNSGD